MRELNVNEVKEVNGGIDMCEAVEIVTETSFTAAGAIIGGATGLGFGSTIGAGLGKLLGGWAADVLTDDMGCP